MAFLAGFKTSSSRAPELDHFEVAPAATANVFTRLSQSINTASIILHTNQKASRSTRSITKQYVAYNFCQPLFPLISHRSGIEMIVDSAGTAMQAYTFSYWKVSGGLGFGFHVH